MDIITNGPKLDLKKLPTQNIRPNYPLSSNNNEIISIETTKLLNKLIIGYSTPDKGEKKKVSKKDGNKRKILNLKNFDKFVNYKHFKMESINNVINLIKPNVYMTSSDLKDAFFSVPIHNEYQKYLKFMFGNLF